MSAESLDEQLEKRRRQILAFFNPGGESLTQFEQMLLYDIRRQGRDIKNNWLVNVKRKKR